MSPLEYLKSIGEIFESKNGNFYVKLNEEKVLVDHLEIGLGSISKKSLHRLGEKVKSFEKTCNIILLWNPSLNCFLYGENGRFTKITTRNFHSLSKLPKHGYLIRNAFWITQKDQNPWNKEFNLPVRFAKGFKTLEEFAEFVGLSVEETLKNKNDIRSYVYINVLKNKSEPIYEKMAFDFRKIYNKYPQLQRITDKSDCSLVQILTCYRNILRVTTENREFFF